MTITRQLQISSNLHSSTYYNLYAMKGEKSSSKGKKARNSSASPDHYLSNNTSIHTLEVRSLFATKHMHYAKFTTYINGAFVHCAAAQGDFTDD